MVRAARDLSDHPDPGKELRPRDRRCLLGVTPVLGKGYTRGTRASDTPRVAPSSWPLQTLPQPAGQVRGVSYAAPLALSFLTVTME